MENIKNWFKNKSIGYYIALGVAVLSLIFVIIFAVTFKGQMGNKEDALIPATIIPFMIAGIIVEAAALVIPQYRFIQIVAALMFALALYKDILIIPDFIAGVVNHVEYNGGNTPLNFFYFIALLVIVIAAAVPAFIGFYKNEKEANADFKDIKGPKLVKTCSSGVAVVAAVLVASLVAVNLEKGRKAINPDSYSPITDEIRQAAEECEYDFDPTSVIIKEKETTEYDFNDSELKGLQLGFTREGYNLVYYFEGVYTEGYQGDYSPYYAEMYLWDDGKFVGKSHNDTFRGYWYNSSLGKTGYDEEGNDLIDCCTMKSTGNYETISTDAVSGFYQRQGYAYLNPGWGGRSVVVSGYYYYPEVAIFIDKGTDTKEYHVGDTFNRGSWVAKRVLKNLSYSAVFKGESVKWTDEEGMHDSDNVLLEAGEYKVTAKWNNFEAETTVVVKEALEIEE